MSAWVWLTVTMVTAVRASHVTFEASPTVLVENLTTGELTMRCEVTEDTHSDVAFIKNMLITRNGGEAVAYVYVHGDPMTLADPGNLGVKGEISLTQGQGDLIVTWTNSSRVELGNYTCKVTALDTTGHIVVMTSSLTLTTAPPYVAYVMADFNSKLQEQQQTITQLQLTNEQQQQIIEQQQLTNEEQQMINYQQQQTNEQQLQINEAQQLTNDQQQQTNVQQQLKNEQQQLINEQHQVDIQTLTQGNNQQQTEISKLKSCSSTHVAFHAAMSISRFTNKRMTIPSGDIPVWDLVALNEGGAYDSSTGLFTCAVAGVYTFTVHMQGVTGSRACLKLEKNGVKISGMFKDDDDHYGDATLSHVIDLHSGDVLRLKSTCTTVLYQNDNSSQSAVYRVNYFMGHLVTAAQCTE